MRTVRMTIYHLLFIKTFVMTESKGDGKIKIVQTPQERSVLNALK